MRTFKVKIKNFMIISDAELEFKPGLTTIVGPSNNGKSSILLALQAMLYNQSVDAMIKQGEENTTLGIQYDGNTIMWRRNLKSGAKIVYKVNKETLTKVGRTQPEEVLAVLPFEDKPIAATKVRLNFVNQGDPPLLVHTTGSALYEFLAKSNQTEELSKVVVDMKEDIKDMNTRRNSLEGAIEYLRSAVKEEREEYQRVKACDFTVMRIIELDSKNNKIEDLNETINNVIKNNKEVKKIKESTKQVVDKLSLIEKYVNTVEPLYSKVDSLQESIKQVKTNIETRDTLTQELKVVSESLDNLRLEEVSENLTNLQQLSVSLSSLQDTMDKLHLQSEKKALLEKQVEQVNVELKEVENLLSEFNVCPLCHSQLKGVNHEH